MPRGSTARRGRRRRGPHGVTARDRPKSAISTASSDSADSAATGTVANAAILRRQSTDSATWLEALPPIPGPAPATITGYVRTTYHADTTITATPATSPIPDPDLPCPNSWAAIPNLTSQEQFQIGDWVEAVHTQERQQQQQQTISSSSGSRRLEALAASAAAAASAKAPQCQAKPSQAVPSAPIIPLPTLQHTQTRIDAPYADAWCGERRKQQGAREGAKRAGNDLVQRQYERALEQPLHEQQPTKDSCSSARSGESSNSNRSHGTNPARSATAAVPNVMHTANTTTTTTNTMMTYISTQTATSNTKTTTTITSAARRRCLLTAMLTGGPPPTTAARGTSAAANTSTSKTTTSANGNKHSQYR
ncbi:mucin-5AC-like [Drosophila miranda]|uniref:mucin-5AC-like n=1 Tax=Drosophila miranda TaxID=7229 RepID=UPI00143F5928|nr:mucin-5AC-like [Drosophila miranda]